MGKCKGVLLILRRATVLAKQGQRVGSTLCTTHMALCAIWYRHEEYLPKSADGMASLLVEGIHLTSTLSMSLEALP